MTARRQDSGETWGNNLKRRRIQGNVTEKEKKMTIGKMLVSQARKTKLLDRKENSNDEKRDPNKSPGQAKEKRPAGLYQAAHLS